MALSSVKLRCPSCQSDFDWDAAESIACSHCSMAFPTIGEIAWFYRDPERFIEDWKAQVSFYLQEIERQGQGVMAASQGKGYLKSTYARLKHLEAGYVEQGKSVRKLLEPLLLAQTPAILKETGTKLPMSQGLLSYESNVFRDWCWGTEENIRTLELYKSVIPAGVANDVMIVLGAGAGRLPADLHQVMSVKTSLFLDINPLLFFVAKQVLKGQEVRLVEFPLAPKSSVSTAVSRTLRHKYTDPIGDVRFLFADAMNPPMASKSVDILLSHWFLDIVPQDLRSLLPRLNRVLKPGGVLLNGGSMAFSAGGPERRYTKEEFSEALDEAGFEVVTTKEEELPYLRCPDSSHSRVERVFCMAARKVRDVQVPKDYKYLADWIVNSTLPIPMHSAIQGSFVQHKVFLDILVHVDGKRSLQQVAALFAKTYRLKPEEALAPVRAFFTREYENGLFDRMS